PGQVRDALIDRRSSVEAPHPLLRAALENCAAGRTKVATVMRHAAADPLTLLWAKMRTRARDREAQGQWLVANSMRRSFPFWPAVGESCPSITVNSTGVAITATSSNAIEQPLRPSVRCRDGITHAVLSQ